jgi:octaprenyl-diphosphate synthase
MQAIRNAVAEEFEIVNQLVIAELHSEVALVESIGHYIVDAGGKRLRPLLVLLCGKALNGETQNITQLAAIVEFIHTATLLHDDVVDISSLRRGRPTANAEWGNAPSVLVGDFIYSRAFQLMVRMGNMDIMALMANTTNRIAEGEVLQLERAGKPDTSEDAYYRIIEQKTAVLFEAATQGAAILANCDLQTQQSAKSYGHHLGMAFQLIDDVLDYTGDAAAMGKNVGDDLNEGKPTLPLIYAMKHGSALQKELIHHAIESKSSDNIAEIITAVNDTGALDYTKAKAQSHRDRAIESIANFPNCEQTIQMGRLADLAIQRNH